MLLPSMYQYQKIVKVKIYFLNKVNVNCQYVLAEIFEDLGIEFTKIKSDGSEWFYNDQPATRNFTRVVQSSEVYSNAVFLGQSSLLKSVRDIETIGTDQVYAEINLERIEFPQTVPSQVNIYYKQLRDVFQRFDIGIPHNCIGSAGDYK